MYNLRKYSFLLIFVLLTVPVNAQYMGRIEERGKVSVKIEAERFLWDKIGMQRYSVKRGYFPDPVGQYRQDKVKSIIFAGSRIKVQLIEPKLKKPLSYYHKIIDSRGTDVTQAVDSTQRSNVKGLIFSESPFEISGTLIDTTLKVGDYFFIDFYDSTTQKLIRSYYIKRLRIYPELTRRQKEKPTVFQPDSTVTVEFSNRDKLSQDALEYRLIKGRDTSTWKAAGFTLHFDYLKTNSYYQLEARYIFQPESITQYRFSVRPDWYQGSLFRLLTIGAIFFIFHLVTRGRKRRHFGNRK